MFYNHQSYLFIIVLYHFTRLSGSLQAVLDGRQLQRWRLGFTSYPLRPVITCGRYTLSHWKSPLWRQRCNDQIPPAVLEYLKEIAWKNVLWISLDQMASFFFLFFFSLTHNNLIDLTSFILISFHDIIGYVLFFFPLVSPRKVCLICWTASKDDYIVSRPACMGSLQLMEDDSIELSGMPFLSSPQTLQFYPPLPPWSLPELAVFI